MRDANLWLGAIWLTEQGIKVSASQFCALAETAYSSAWTIFQKLSLVLAGEDSVEYQRLSSASFSELICKRSRETPARGHPFAEEALVEAETQDGQPSKAGHEVTLASVDVTPDFDHQHSADETRSSLSSYVSPKPAGSSGDEREDIDLFTLLGGKEEQVHDRLSDEPLDFDSLCAHLDMSPADLSAALVMLELAQKVVCLPGDRYVRVAANHHQQSICDAAQLSYDTAADSANRIHNFANSIRTIFHGISRKYLQPYLARDWCHVDRVRWCQDAVVRACLRFGPISYREVVDYVTPITVKVFACQ